MEIIKKSNNVTKIDVINASGSLPFKDLVEKTAEIRGAAIINDVNKDGELESFAYMFAVDGTVYAGNSSTMRDSIDALIDLFEDEPDATFNVTTEARTASSGRTFYTLKILQ